MKPAPAPTYAAAHAASLATPAGFWAEQAQAIQWFEQPTQVLAQQGGLYRWFIGGQLNTCYLCLDYHVANGRAEQVALIQDSPVTNTVRRFTYRELLELTARFAGGLRDLGVAKGDRVIIYMPNVPEAVIAMLACARLGAVHSVVFGGFAPHELAVRINDAQPKVIVSASGGIEIDKIIPYKPLVDAAIEQANHKPKHVVVLQREAIAHSVHAHMQPGRDVDYQTLLQVAPADCVPVAATDPLYILYTSGTTGKPKGVVRDNGGHAVALKYSMSAIYGVQPGETFWAASDIGWAVGHSYIVYGPLLHGCSSVLYEGKPVRTPDAGAFWRVIQQHGVSVLFTAPTAIRAIKKEDPEGLLLKQYKLPTLRHLFLAGERCDPATYEWAGAHLGVPVIDHWWQTESGWPMLATMVGLADMPAPRAGSAGHPVPGYDVQILDEAGQPVPAGTTGLVAVRLPLPPGCLPTLWNDDERFRQSYLSTFPGYYLSGDGGYQDAEGYLYIMGRVDDVINVAGHRLSTGEMEELLAAHPAVAECAVLGIACELRGQRPVGLVVLKDGQTIGEAQLETELVQRIREQIGAVACFRQVLVVKRLPKTRSGKILRKTMRQLADGEAFSTPSTIDDPLILDEIKAAMAARGIGRAFEPAADLLPVPAPQA
ncbi:propionyl-CoA synthetase [Hymenobacter latericus]|uniref:propionyl-CoA synthetase n=1 Tax=Hymenobacter sp. YIM 151858-1 TaxID=2987688 RepID=UPI002227BFFE|nr:propionyl-CoA synthetase [Hymenobacter sp. YIM 151858-1]UYZ60391.1 propionyl-CoA synthetase [Hymenobacter sp. YIM 151858-1]